MTKTETVDTVLAFWFEESTPEQWFKKDDVFDATIRNRFEPTIISSLKGEKDSWDYAQRHRDIIARFGRFPHRNAILGRPSSSEETEFLTQPGSSF